MGRTFMDVLARLQKFSDDRDWGKYHTPRNLAVSVAIEAGELLEHFQWDYEDELDKHLEENKSYIEEEVCDVLIYALNLAMQIGMDPADAINNKITKNELRFLPPGAERPVGGA